MDERVKRVADVVSDHNLIIANIKLKLRNRKGKHGKKEIRLGQT